MILEKYQNAIIAVLLIAVAIAASVHFLHAYERLSAQRLEVAVTIPEGSTIYDIDKILSGKDVLAPGEFVANVSSSLEGHLFPDTYDFYVSSTVSSVVQKFLTNFNVKAEPLFAGKPEEQDLIIASLVQKEVASSTDMAIVAGILEKRLAAGDYLNVDATICYAKQMAEFAVNPNPTSTMGCYPITEIDLRMKSPYNNYLYKGLPPGPIGNPGVEAIEATLNPQSSTYWYYLSDPKTGATIYADTLEEQVANQRKYLQ
jgi:UPF0755 protein